MGWDQGTGRQDVQSFLLELMEIDPNELLREALAAKMAERGLTHEVVSDSTREEGDGLYNVFTPDRVVLSDGRVFVEAVTETERGDDWGNDYYSFVDVSKPYTVTTSEWHYNPAEDDPHVSTEEVMYVGPGSPTYGEVLPVEKMPSSLEELREQGNATAEGMGDEIAAFFASQGITEVAFAPAEECLPGRCGGCGGDDGSICDCPCHVEEGGVGC